MSAIRSGPLLKRGGAIIKHWTKKHCVLSQAGIFEVYEKDSDSSPSLTIDVKKEVKDVITGFSCSINLPSGHSDMEACMGVVCKSKTHYFLATTVGECRMWAGVLKTARTSTAVQGKKVAQAPPAFDAPPQPQVPVAGYAGHYAGGAAGGYAGMQQPPGPYQHPGPGGYAPVVPVYEQQVNVQPTYPVQGQPQPMYGGGVMPGHQTVVSREVSDDGYGPGQKYMAGQQYMAGEQYMPGQPHSP